MREQLAENERMLAEQAKSWEQKLEESRARSAAAAADARATNSGLSALDEANKEKMQFTPHFLNLNEDKQLSQRLVFFLQPGSTVFGSGNSDGNPETNDGEGDHFVKLEGLSMRPRHCVVKHAGDDRTTGALSLAPGARGARVFVNGKQLEFGGDGVRLRNGDRVILGDSHVFRAVLPGEPPPEDLDPSAIDFQFVMRELNAGQLAKLTKDEVERRRKAEEQAAKMEAKVRELEAMVTRAQRDASQEKMRLGAAAGGEASPAESQRRINEEVDRELRHKEAKLAKQIDDTRRLKAMQERAIQQRRVLETGPWRRHSYPPRTRILHAAAGRPHSPACVFYDDKIETRNNDDDNLIFFKV